jgi:Spy/CpxP family protein refolding chaperone
VDTAKTPIRQLPSLLCSALLVLCLSAVIPSEASSGRSGFGRGSFGGPVSLLNLREVQRELRLDEEQLSQIRQLNAELREKGQALFQNSASLPPEERDRRFHEFRAGTQRRLREILDARQSARLRQIELQQWGLRAIGRPDVQAELRLSGEQKARIAAAFDGEHTAMQRAFQEFRSGGQTMTENQKEVAFARYRELRAATHAKLNAVLTEAQRKQFQAMQGPPFEFPPRPGFGAKRSAGR